MPEIAEVALTAQILKKYYKGKKLLSFKFVDGRYKKKNPDMYKKFTKSLPLKVINIDSKGKFMWFELFDAI